METLINEYRYVALMLGTFLEGETAILLASSLIHKGLFDGRYTLLFAFAGSFFSDWLYYLIGRLNGKVFLSTRPNLKMKVDPLANYFNKHRILLLLSYRFMYGFRVIIPVMFGITGIKPGQFLVCSVFTGLLWTSLLSAMGFLAGSVFSISTDSITENLPFVLVGFALFGLVLGYSVKSIVSRHLQLA